MVVEYRALYPPGGREQLAWTDALGPGPGGEVPAWVNDVDLTVVDPSSRTYRGNVRQD